MYLMHVYVCVCVCVCVCVYIYIYIYIIARIYALFEAYAKEQAWKHGDETSKSTGMWKMGSEVMILGEMFVVSLISIYVGVCRPCEYVV